MSAENAAGREGDVGTGAYRPEPVVAEVAAILAGRYDAGSPDGLVSVVVGGDQRVASLALSRVDGSPGVAGQAVAAAANDGLERARRGTVDAMIALPGIDPRLKAVMAGEADPASLVPGRELPAPESLDVDHEATDAGVRVTVNGRTRTVGSVFIEDLTADGVEQALVTALNAALDLAGSGGARAGLHADLDQLQQRLEENLGRITERLENVSADLESMLKSL